MVIADTVPFLNNIETLSSQEKPGLCSYKAGKYQAKNIYILKQLVTSNGAVFGCVAMGWLYTLWQKGYLLLRVIGSLSCSYAQML